MRGGNGAEDLGSIGRSSIGGKASSSNCHVGVDRGVGGVGDKLLLRLRREGTPYVRDGKFSCSS